MADRANPLRQAVLPPLVCLATAVAEAHVARATQGGPNYGRAGFGGSELHLDYLQGGLRATYALVWAAGAISQILHPYIDPNSIKLQGSYKLISTATYLLQNFNLFCACGSGAVNVRWSWRWLDDSLSELSFCWSAYP